MKLEGSLDAFSLPDVFQLLSFTKKTGGLHLAQRRLATASSSSPAVRSPAPPRTARGSRWPAAWSAAAPSTDEALAAAVAGRDVRRGRRRRQRAARPGRRRRRPAAAWRRATSRSTRSSTCCAGRTATSPSSWTRPTPTTSASSLAVEAVLADAEARRASWESVSQVVPSPQRACSRCRSCCPPTRRSAARSGRCWRWSTAGARVTELVDLTGSGQYAVVSTLAALVQRGLLEVRATPADATTDHVTVVCAASGCSRRWRVEPFVPVQEAAAERAGRRSPTTGRAGPRRPSRRRSADVAAVAPEPMHSVPRPAPTSTTLRRATASASWRPRRPASRAR